MEKVAFGIQKFLLYALPIVAIEAVWINFSDIATKPFDEAPMQVVLWNIVNTTSGLWAASIVLFMVLFFLDKSVKARLIRSLAKIHERDEREEVITGRAALGSWITTLALVIFLIFVSLLTIKVEKLPTAEQIDGKTKRLSIGLDYSPFAQKSNQVDGNQIFDSKSYSLSASSLLILIGLTQLISFTISSRKMMKED